MAAKRMKNQAKPQSGPKPTFSAPQPPKKSAEIDVAEWVDKVEQLPDMRWEKVQQIREALASGEYNVDERMEKILENMSNALATPKSDK
jgi:anti-sigma28 factor (negative regulator of flagellin synthesis)